MVFRLPARGMKGSLKTGMPLCPREQSVARILSKRPPARKWCASNRLGVGQRKVSGCLWNDRQPENVLGWGLLFRLLRCIAASRLSRRMETVARGS